MFGFLLKEEHLLPPLRLEGFRVALRPPRESDATEFLALRARNKNFLKPYEPQWPADALTRDFFLRRLQKQARNWNEDRGNYFLIQKKDEMSLIGGMNINGIRRGNIPYGSLGYWIDRDHQGRGYMSESMRLIIRYGFEDLGLRRIIAASLPHNARSRALLIRAGFREQGLIEQYLQIDGRKQDHVLYHLNYKDWAKRI
jgi:ribosomal-protein-alanine N-acetyltransferase